MFKTKKDVDRHVRTALSKLRSDNEKNLRGLTIAKLYFKINEYATAQHYIAGYLSVNEECAPAHKLLGQCLLQLKKNDSALASFQRSLNLDPKQPDLLIQICKLLVSDDFSLNINKAKYWCDLAESENVQHDAVFSLRLKLLNKNNSESTLVEELILKEIALRPTDPNLRVRIIKHFMEQNKITEAFKYAYDLEMKNHTVFSGCIDWYNIIWLMLTKYKQQPNAKKSWEYWLLLMICIERQVDLSFSNSNNSLLSSGGITNIANLLFTFDQHLYEASKCVIDLSPEKELGAQFLYHFRGQLCLYAAALIYRREQIQNKNQWHEATKNALPLLLFAFHCGTPDTKESWLKHSGEMSRQLIQIWHREAAFRCAQAGRTLLSCVDNSRDETLSSQVHTVMSDHSIWSSVDDVLSQIRQFCSDNGWRTKLFRLLFPNSDQLVKMQTSHLITSDQLAEPVYELPKYAEIENYEEIAQYLRPESLQHMVYLCMGLDNLADVRCKYFNGLHFSSPNLAFCGAESLNQLDIETFLYATTIQAKRLYEVERFQYENYNSKVVGKPAIMPFANMSLNLCSEEHSNWWQAAYQVYKNLAGENLAELRAILQYGMEAVRGVNGPKMDLIIVLKLGKLLVTRAQDATKTVEKGFLDARVQTLYKYGLTMLKLHSKGVLEPFRKLFKYKHANSSSVERDITSLAEEAVTYIAARHFKNAEYEECIEELSGIQLPYATYFQAEAYRKLDESNKTPKKTKKLYSDKAKDCLNQTLNLLGFLNQNHPLNSVVHSEIKRMQYTDLFLNETQNNELQNNEEFLNESFSLNRSRREAQNASIASNKTAELENLIKQMLSTLSFVKEELVDKIKPEVSDIRKDMSALKEKMATIEESIKKRSEPPSRDDATNVLDDLYIMGDDLQQGMFSGYNQPQQRMQTPNTLLNQPPIHHAAHNPPPPPAPTNLYNSPLFNQIVGTPANALLNQQSHTPQFGGSAPPANIYNTPIYNPNYPFNYYPQIVMPPGTMNFGLPNQQQQLMPPTDSSLSLFDLLTQQASSAPAVHSVDKPLLEKPTTQPITQPTSNVPGMWNRLYNNAPVEKGPPVNVVITSSDPLPAHTTVSTQSTLSVTIPPQHIKPSIVANDMISTSQQQSITNYPMVPVHSLGSNIFGMNTTTTVASVPSITSTISFAPPKVDVEPQTANQVNESTDGDDLHNKSSEIEYDPRPDFKPIIPLPDEIEVKTGEENEEVLFCSRAKLLRLIEKEWKERGVGDIKILKNKSDGKIRILMRREQTHKICANHNISAEMNLVQAKTDAKSYIWCANDFADEVVKFEKLCVRFKFVETGKEFSSIFAKAQADLKASDSEVTKPNTIKEPAKITEPFGLAKSSTFNFAKSTITPALVPDASNSSPLLSKSPFITSSITEPMKESKAAEAKVSPFSNFSFAPTSVAPKTDSPFSSIFAKTLSNTPLQEKSPLLTQPIATVSTPKQNAQTKELNKSIGAEADEDEYVPTAQFKPVIPLPELVAVQTGEENEKTLFEHRAKLLRFDKTTGEWKERGIGIIKVLVDKNDSNRVRLVMRREQIFKLCCNQRLTKKMIFTNPQNSRNALTWCGQDFSENELQTEVFAVRFKTAETCEEFHNVILKAQQSMLEGTETQNTEEHNKSKPFAFGKTKKDGVLEAAEVSSTTEGFGDKFKPKPGSWSCVGCYTSNGADVLYCVACEHPKDDTVPKKSSTIFGSTNITPVKSNFTFGFGSPQIAKQVENVKPTEGFGDKFKPKAGSWSCEACYVSNDGALLYCSACESPKNSTVQKKEPKNLFAPANPNKFTFGFTPAAVDLTKPTVNPVDALKSTISDNSVNQQTDANKSFQFGNSGGFNFTKPTTETNAFDAAAAVSTPFTFSLNNASPATLFGVSTETPESKTTISTGPRIFDLNQKVSTLGEEKSDNGFKLEKNNFNFSMKPKSPGKAKSPLKSTGGDESDTEDIEEENNTYFTPVIPLPDKVEVVTGEENEEEVYCHRAKLYRFTGGEWKERGIGDVKILRHKETKKLRVVMRREQVLKICLNHALTSDIEYKPKDEKSWHFVANDFSEGELQSMVFSLRFKNTDISNKFMEAIKNALQETDTSENETSDRLAESSERSKTESQISDEHKKLADRLQLPYSFYEDIETSKCPGCRGCDPDSFQFPGYEDISQDSITQDPLPLFMPELSASTSNRSILKQSILATPIFSPKPDANNGTKNIFGGGGNLFSTPNGIQSTKNVETVPSASENKFVFSLGDSKPEVQNNFESGGFLFGNSKTQFGGNADNARPVFGQTSIFGNANITAPTAPTIFGAKPALTATSDTQNNIFGNAKPKEGEPLFGNKTNFTFATSGFGTSFGATTTGSLFGGASVFGSSNTEATAKQNSDSTTTNIFKTALESANKENTANKDDSGLSSGALWQHGKQTNDNAQLNTFTTTGITLGSANKENAVNNDGIKPNLAEPVFKNDPGLSFASLAATAAATEEPGFTTSTVGQTTRGFIGLKGNDDFSIFLTSAKDIQDRKLNVSNTSQDGDVAAASNDDAHYDPHYEPIIALPELIAVSTGEENEEKLFGERSVLYRYDTTNKEWKERGTGELKILYHPDKETYRLILRREQIHKLVLNHGISDDFQLKPMNASGKSFCWAAMNYAESPAEIERLAVRFKNADLASRFESEIMRCVEQVKQRGADLEPEED